MTEWKNIKDNFEKFSLHFLPGNAMSYAKTILFQKSNEMSFMLSI